MPIVEESTLSNPIICENRDCEKLTQIVVFLINLLSIYEILHCRTNIFLVQHGIVMHTEFRKYFRIKHVAAS